MVAAVAVGAAIGHAAGPEFGTPTERTFSRITTYEYSERRYEPPVRIDGASLPGTPSYNGPEGVLQAHVSAMMLGDIDAWLETWDARSRARLGIEIERKPGGRDGVRREWAAIFEGAVVRLTQWADIDRNVVLVYEVEAAAGKRTRYAVVLGASDEGWRVTLVPRFAAVVDALLTGVHEIRRERR